LPGKLASHSPFDICAADPGLAQLEVGFRRLLCRDVHLAGWSRS
jgi:hypothetical protein